LQDGWIYLLSKKREKGEIISSRRHVGVTGKRGGGESRQKIGPFGKGQK